MNERSPISIWAFALVVVKLGRRVLLVHERSGVGWSIPGGRMYTGETVHEACRRLVREEAGLAIELEGVLKVQYTPIPGGESRFRVCCVARPQDDRQLRDSADARSMTARWYAIEEITALQLRSDQVRGLIRQALEGPIYPLDVLMTEE